VEKLLQGSSYTISDVKSWLADHDSHPWTATRMLYRERGPTGREPEHLEELFEFVRSYPKFQIRRSRQPWNRAMSIPTSPEHTPAMEEEIEVIGAGNFSTSLLAPDRPFRPPMLRSIPLPEESTIMAGDEAPRQYLSDPRSTEPSEVYDMPTPLPESLLNKLRRVGMGRYLDYYARRDCGMDPNGSGMPAFVREEILVDCNRGVGSGTHEGYNRTSGSAPISGSRKGVYRRSGKAGSKG
jgi:hypothetical protein